MATSRTFHLPDLGEGLPDATIVEWLVKEGDTVKLDEPLVSMETAKAVVEVPSPFSGKLAKVHGKDGDVIETGAALADFEIDPKMPQRAEAEATGHHHAPPKPAKAAASKGAGNEAPDQKGVIASDEGGEIAENDDAGRADEGTVVGAMQTSDRVHAEQATSVGGVKAVPAVRALAKKLGVDLARVAPSGAGGVVTMKDVKDAAAAGTARVGARARRAARSTPMPSPAAGASASPASGRGERTHAFGSGQADAHDAADGCRDGPAGTAQGRAPQHGARHGRRTREGRADDAGRRCRHPRVAAGQRHHRAAHPRDRARVQDRAGAERLVRRREPDAHAASARRHRHRGRHRRWPVRAGAAQCGHARSGRRARRGEPPSRAGREIARIAPSELSGYTISLSNFGVFAGRYATPVVVPPCVAIVAAGKGRHQMTPVMGGFESHRVIPLSLTFDHRAATGGEAARFLKAMLDDLALAQ